MGKQSIAQAVLEAVGGKSNVSSNEVCMTRLRLTLADPSQVDDTRLNDVPEVLGTVGRGSNGIEVVFGPRLIEDINASLTRLLSADPDTEPRSSSSSAAPAGQDEASETDPHGSTGVQNGIVTDKAPAHADDASQQESPDTAAGTTTGDAVATPVSSTGSPDGVSADQPTTFAEQSPTPTDRQESVGAEPPSTPQPRILVRDRSRSAVRTERSRRGLQVAIPHDDDYAKLANLLDTVKRATQTVSDFHHTVRSDGPGAKAETEGGASGGRTTPNTGEAQGSHAAADGSEPSTAPAPAEKTQPARPASPARPTRRSAPSTSTTESDAPANADSPARSVLVINGPNINMLGIREPDIYGSTSFATLLELCHRSAREAGFARCTCYQSNHEGDLVDEIQDAYQVYDGIVINPGAYTHTSIALLDALKAVGIPTVEVHISKVSRREKFRQVSYLRAACFETVMGLGIDGYRKAIFDLAAHLGMEPSALG